MKKLLLIILPIFILLQCTNIRAAQQEYDPQNTLLTLNYAIMSIYRVEKWPSKVTIDEEYSGIINNLAVGNISNDQELLDLFTAMMAAYTENRLDEKDRKLIQQQYEVLVNKAFLQIKPDSHIKAEAVASAAQNLATSASGGLWGLVGGLFSSSVAGISEYQLALQANERMRMQSQSEEQGYMQQRMSAEWQLDKEKIRRFNGLKMKLLSASWHLLNKYGLPDSGRLTEDIISQYYSFISEEDNAKALRMGKRLEESFAFYPPFWFHYGVFALHGNDIAKARSCFEKFETISRPILRKDQFMAAMARYKVFTLAKQERDEAKRLLRLIEDHSATDDWNNYLFAALQWHQLGEKKKAEELLLRNMDMDFDVALHTEMRHQLKTGKVNLQAVQNIAIQEFSETEDIEALAKSGNAEAQYRLGIEQYRKSWGLKYRKGVDWLSKAAAQGHLFAKIPLISDKLEGKKWQKESKKIFDELQTLAQNSAPAQTWLGVCYSEGIGVRKDETKAVQYYLQAAEQGNAHAQRNLGFRYYRGVGVVKDFTKAVQWYHKASDQGDYIAQYNLALCYNAGEGGSKDMSKTFYWLQKAADQGLIVAQFSLGAAYARGEGISKDLGKAVELYQKAADQGYAEAQFFLGGAYERGEGVSKDLTKAAQWYQQAAEQGHPKAQCKLGYCYIDGQGVPPNLSKGVQWIQKSAEQGYAVAQFVLGVFYMDGKGVPKDLVKGVQWYQKAADQGYANAEFYLAGAYLHGYGVTKDLKKALQWMQKSANHGFAKSQYDLCLRYYRGDGVSKDWEVAAQWCQKAAEQGHADAQIALAFCYEQGEGVSQDLDKAKQWFRKAAEQGREDAAQHLQRLEAE